MVEKRVSYVKVLKLRIQRMNYFLNNSQNNKQKYVYIKIDKFFKKPSLFGFFSKKGFFKKKIKRGVVHWFFRKNFFY